MPLDAHPRVREYLEGLPSGFESYPECKVRAEVFAAHRQLIAKRLKVADLPPPIAAVLGAKVDTWIPDTVGTCLPLLLRDHVFDDDGALMRFTADAAMQLFTNPLYRALMRVLSPMLILSGTARRWGTFRSGSTLQSRSPREAGGRKHVELDLVYPPRLFPPLMLHTFAIAFQVSIELSGTKETKAELLQTTGSSATFDLSWRA